MGGPTCLLLSVAEGLPGCQGAPDLARLFRGPGMAR